MVGNRGSVVESDFYTKLKNFDVQEGKKDKFFANHVTQVCEAHNRVIVSFLQQVQGGTRPTTEGWGRTLGTMCTCEEIKRGTHACRASKLGPVERWWTQDSKLGITRPPPRVRKTDTFIVFYLFVLHSVTCLKTCHFAACFTSLWTSIPVFYVNTAPDVVTVLLIFAKNLSLYLHILTCTYRDSDTHTQANMYN